MRPVFPATVLLVAFLVPSAAGAELEQFEVPLRDGPLLTFVAYDDTRGRVSEHHAFQPGDAQPRVFLRQRGNLSWACRVGKDVLVGRSHQAPRGLYAFDVTRGTKRRVVPDESTQLVGHDGSELFVVTGRRGESQQLFAVDALDPDFVRPLLRRPVEEVLRTDTRAFFVVARKPDRALWRVPREAGAEPQRVCAIDPAWSLSLLTITHSPSGRLVALGAASRDDAFGGRDLLVVDVESGKIHFERRAIPVHVVPTSSSLPRLRTRFLDERTLRYSETVKKDDAELTFDGSFRWVDVDLATGKTVREAVYGPMDLRHREPPGGVPAQVQRPERWEDGGFDRSVGRLFLRGAKAPLIDARDPERAGRIVPHEATVALGGRWAATMLGSEGVLRIHDARSGKSAPVFARWGHTLRWWSSD